MYHGTRLAVSVHNLRRQAPKPQELAAGSQVILAHSVTDLMSVPADLQGALGVVLGPDSVNEEAHMVRLVDGTQVVIPAACIFPIAEAVVLEID